MAVFYFSLNAFEICDTILSASAAQHITDRHLIATPLVRKSLFSPTFPLEDKLKAVSWYPWHSGYDGVRLLDKGFREGHGTFYIYVFTMNAYVGTDPEGFRTNKMAVSEPKAGVKWNIISAYPFTESYDSYLCYRRNRFTCS